MPEAPLHQAVIISDAQGNLDPEVRVVVQNFEEMPVGSGGGSLPEEIDVNVLNFPGSQPVNVQNFPPTQNVNVQNFPAPQQSIEVSNLPANQAVSVSNFPATQGVNVANFPASQNVAVTNFPGSQSVAVSNFPGSQNVAVQNFPSQQSVKPGVPTPSDLIAGSSVAAASTTAATFLTIPAGRTWCGSVSLSIAATATTAFSAMVNTEGTGVSPAAGALLRAACVGAGGNNAVTLPDVMVTAPAGNSVTLQVRSSAASAGSLVAASACGALL